MSPHTSKGWFSSICLVVGLGVVMVGFKVKVGHELVSDKELDKGGEEIIQVEVEA